MIDELISLAQVMLAAVIAFGVMPMLVLPRPPSARNSLDAFVANLLRWVAIVIVASHVLALVGIYNAVTVATLIAMGAWFARFRGSVGGLPGLLERLWPTSGDLPGRERVRRPKPSLRDRLGILAVASPVLALLAFSYWLRARDVFSTMTLSPPDAYVHMTWAASFSGNDLWPDGVYPQGLAAIIAFVDLFAPFTHILEVARFTGPLVTTFLVFALYYAVVRLTRNPGAALLAAGAFALVSAHPLWRLPWDRQVGMLPQEFGLALAVLAIPLAVTAVTERGGGRYLSLGAAGGIALGGKVATVAAAGIAIAMSHPVPGVLFVLLIGVGALSAAVGMRGRWSHAFGVGTAAAFSALAGFAVVPIAELLGVPAYLGYGATEALADVGGADAERLASLQRHFGDLRYLEHSWLSLVAGASGAIALATGVAMTFKEQLRGRGAEIVGLSTVGLVTILLWDLRPLSTQVESFYIVRLANALAPLLPLALGAGLAIITPLLGRLRPLTAPATAMAIGAVALAGVVAPFGSIYDLIDENYEREQIEYDEMALMTREVIRRNDPRTYTVVGLPQQRQVVSGHGFFIALWVFARDIEEVEHDEILPVPPPETFVFVEMDPYPVREITGRGSTEEYYFDRAKRGRIMASTYRWLEERRAVNDDTDIYFDGEHIRVYRIARNPALRVDLDRVEVFQDYRWRPGELFNEGPTSPRQVEPPEAGSP